MRVNSVIPRCLAVLLALSMAGPQELEARGEPTHGFNMFSAQEEVQAGQQASAQVSKQLRALPELDPITIYVQRLGQQLAAQAPGEKWPYNFHVVNQKEINAFALPGGPVYINLGTIQAADNEAELAGVMAHEISPGRRANRWPPNCPWPSWAELWDGVRPRKWRKWAFPLVWAPNFLKNSRQAESEADLLGSDIMYDTGFNPQAMAQFFTKLEREVGARGPQFFSDHPDPGNRAQAVAREVATLPRKTSYRSDSTEFRETKQHVTGMKPLTAQQIADRQTPAMSAAAGDVQPSRNLRNFSQGLPDLLS